MSEGAYLNEQEGRSLTSRRKFLAGSAAALAGGALMAVPGAASAHNPGEPPTDIDILNYALMLERLEAIFYRRVLDRFGESEFENAASSTVSVTTCAVVLTRTSSVSATTRTPTSRRSLM